MILVKHFSIELKVPFVEDKINEENGQEVCAEIRQIIWLSMGDWT